MTVLEAINRLYEEIKKEILDSPTDEATILYLQEALNEAKKTLLDEYKISTKSNK